MDEPQSTHLIQGQQEIAGKLELKRCPGRRVNHCTLHSLDQTSTEEAIRLPKILVESLPCLRNLVGSGTGFQEVVP